MRFLLLIMLGLGLVACDGVKKTFDGVYSGETYYIKNINPLGDDDYKSTIYELYSLKTQAEGLETEEFLVKLAPSEISSDYGCVAVSESDFPLVIKEVPEEAGEESDEVIRVEEPSNFSIKDTNSALSGGLAGSIMESTGLPWLFNTAGWLIKDVHQTIEAQVWITEKNPCEKNEFLDKT